MTALALNSSTYSNVGWYHNIKQPLSNSITGTIEEGLSHLQKKDSDLYKMQDFLDSMKHWEKNWDLYGSKKPKIKSIAKAKVFITNLYRLINFYEYKWLEPNITADSDGDIALEWYNDGKDFSVYISPKEIFYIWFSNPEIKDMHDDTINSVEDVKDVWEWLVSSTN